MIEEEEVAPSFRVQKGDLFKGGKVRRRKAPPLLQEYLVGVDGGRGGAPPRAATQPTVIVNRLANGKVRVCGERKIVDLCDRR